jgi:hypothetical protein
MEIERAADQAELNRLNAESTRRLQGAQTEYYETKASISTAMIDARTAADKGPMAKTKSLKTLAELGIKYGEAGWENQFLTAYLLELGFAADEIGVALSGGGPGAAGGKQVITEAEL